jgi:hypothetical protein
MIALTRFAPAPKSESFPARIGACRSIVDAGGYPSVGGGASVSPIDVSGGEIEGHNGIIIVIPAWHARIFAATPFAACSHT